MSKKLLIRINLEKVRANMSKQEGRQLSEREVQDWLSDANFTAVGDQWLVNEPDLGQLDPSEVLSVEDAPDDQ